MAEGIRELAVMAVGDADKHILRKLLKIVFWEGAEGG